MRAGHFAPLTGVTCTTFASWHGPCERRGFTFCPICDFNELGWQKEHILQLLRYAPGSKLLMTLANPILERPKDLHVLTDGNCSVRLSYISIYDDPRISCCIAFVCCFEIPHLTRSNGSWRRVRLIHHSSLARLSRPPQRPIALAI